MKNIDLHTMRHSAEHLLHQAIKELFPKVDLAMGPATDEGFYNDFDPHGEKVTEADFPQIEKRIKELIDKTTKEKLVKYSVRLKEEEANFGNFYLCPNACVRVGFEKAVDLEYRCPECGNILNHQDNTKTIDFLRSKIKELQMNGMRIGRAKGRA